MAINLHDDLPLLRDMTRRSLTDLLGRLLHLHKMLLEMERRAYERMYGRVTAGELLKLVMHHQQFAWLRALSGIAVSIEEFLDDKDTAVEVEAQRLLMRVRSLLVPVETGSGFARRYYLALQDDPDVVLAHRAVRDVLTAAEADSLRESGGIH